MNDDDKILETKSTKPKPFCFVLMPFKKDFIDIYERGIKPSCIDGGAYCERVDEQLYKGAFIERIYNQISKADFIVADMSGKNPNVFYEVGYAHALGKTTILLTSDFDDIPSDLRHLNHVIYENSITKLHQELTRYVKWFVANPVAEYKKTEVEVDLFWDDINLGTDTPYVDCSMKSGFKVNQVLTIHNYGIDALDKNDYAFNILSKYCVPISKKSFHKTLLPSGEIQYTFLKNPLLLPNSYQSISAQVNQLPSTKGLNKIGDEEYVIFKIVTKTGVRDFKIVLKITE